MKNRPHIYTLTGNLLAERTLEFNTWEIGRTQRAARESFHTRGKGVNVANMLNRLGVPNTALIFAGGSSGAECEAWLHQRGIAYRAFTTRAPSRTGTVIWSEVQPETTFLGPDAAPDADDNNQKPFEPGNKLACRNGCRGLLAVVGSVHVIRL